jgi:hypothetical protein
MVAIGISGETVDVQFNQEAQRFAEQYAKMKKLGKYVGNYLSAVKGKPFLIWSICLNLL